jgi:hypothetical protein
MLMEFFVVFVVLAASLCIAWCGSRRVSLFLFAGALALTVALYLHHATDTLPISL